MDQLYAEGRAGSGLVSSLRALCKGSLGDEVLPLFDGVDGKALLTRLSKGGPLEERVVDFLFGLFICAKASHGLDGDIYWPAVLESRSRHSSRMWQALGLTELWNHMTDLKGISAKELSVGVCVLGICSFGCMGQFWQGFSGSLIGVRMGALTLVSLESVAGKEVPVSCVDWRVLSNDGKDRVRSELYSCSTSVRAFLSKGGLAKELREVSPLEVDYTFWYLSVVDSGEELE